LAFQVDLWSARGKLPKDLIEVEVRQKEIVYSSRNRAATDQYQKMQKLRIAAANLIGQLPAQLHDGDDVKLLKREADDKVCNTVHLIYRSQKYEGIAKDFEFSRRTMEEHWKTGYHNAKNTLANPEVLQLPDRLEGVRTFDLGEDQPEAG
jgi:NTE family protein